MREIDSGSQLSGQILKQASGTHCWVAGLLVLELEKMKSYFKVFFGMRSTFRTNVNETIESVNYALF